MSSKFNRSFRARSKPAVCKQQPPPGPVIACWPPPIASISCAWKQLAPADRDLNVQGIANLQYDAANEAYRGTVYQGSDSVAVTVTWVKARDEFVVRLGYNRNEQALARADWTYTPEWPRAQIAFNVWQMPTSPPGGAVQFSFVAVPLADPTVECPGGIIPT